MACNATVLQIVPATVSALCFCAASSAIIMLNKWTMTKCLGYSMFVLYFVFIAQDLLRNPEVRRQWFGA